MTDNLWANPSFEDGWHHEPYNIPEIQIPDEHEFDFSLSTDNPDDSAGTPFQQPESNVKPREQIPDHEEDDFFLDGNWTWKIFGAGRPIWFKARQRPNLVTGAYALCAPVFPDLYHNTDTDGNKMPAMDARSGQIRIVINGDPSPWQYMGGHNSLVLNNYVFEFDIFDSGVTTIEVEFKLPHPLKSNGIFTDGWSLVRVGDLEECEPARGAPRVQYKRLYILLPQGFGTDWWDAAAAGSAGHECTIGGSADDAGLGDLDDRAIIAVNPGQIGTGLTQSWYDEFYPGAEIVKMIDARTPAELEQALKDFFSGNQPPPPPPPPPEFVPVTLHLQTEVDGWIQFVEKLCARGTPPGAVKFVGGFESAKVVKAIDPTILTIGRFYDQNQGRWLGTGNDAAAAVGYTDQFADAVQPAGIDIVSSLNETIATDNLDTIRKHVDFDVAWIKHVRDRWQGAVSAVALEVAVGNPREGQQTDMLRPVAYETVAASEGARNPFFIGYHSYWWGAPLAAQIRQAGITSYPDSLFAEAYGEPKPIIIQPNILRALRENDNERAAQWTRFCFNTTHYPGGVQAGAQSMNFESGLIPWWEWHAGRSLVYWRASFNAVGLDPYQLLTEIGVVGSPDRGPTLFASSGWRDSICYNGYWPMYESDLIWWQNKVRSYGDIVRAGTIFTVGDDYVGWHYFKIKKDQMLRLSEIL